MGSPPLIARTNSSNRNGMSVGTYGKSGSTTPTNSTGKYVALELFFLGEAGATTVRANLGCRLVDPSGILQPSREATSASRSFQHHSDSTLPVFFMSQNELRSSGHLKSGSLTVEYAITVFKDLNAIPVPPSSLSQHLGKLLESQAGADVVFAVSGESFPAHKNVLAAMSPVFMSAFFGEMAGKSSRRVEVEEMEPSVFGAMLRFIYTDVVPELDDLQQTATEMARHVLVAADRYGLDRLKVLCERRLAFAVDASNAATTLALAEQRGCLLLKAKCIEFIAGGSRENLDAVLETEGFKDLQASIPTLVIELLKAAHGGKN